MRRTAPLHPILVHFTIALVGASLVSDVVGRAFGLSSLLTTAWWLIAAAAPITLTTVITGVVSRHHVPIAEGTALRYLRLHTALGPTFFGCLLAMTIWRAVVWKHASSPGVWYLLALGGVTTLMTIQGYLGGELVYGFGVGVRGTYDRLPGHRTWARLK